MNFLCIITFSLTLQANYLRTPLFAGFYHAMKDCNSDSPLSDCAKEFIRFFIKDLKNEDVYLSKPPEKQYKSIDVLITVNDKYKVIIEDKTHTADHDNQLIRYREIVQKDFDGFLPEFRCPFHCRFAPVLLGQTPSFGQWSPLLYIRMYRLCGSFWFHNPASETDR